MSFPTERAQQNRPSRSTLHRRARERAFLAALEGSNSSTSRPSHFPSSHPYPSAIPHISIQASLNNSSTSARQQPVAQWDLDGSHNHVNNAVDVHFLAQEFEERRRTFSPRIRTLTFMRDPRRGGPSKRRPVSTILMMNTGAQALVLAEPLNRHFLNYEEYIFASLEDVLELPQFATEMSQSVHAWLVTSLRGEITRLEAMRCDEWDRRRLNRPDATHSTFEDTSRLYLVKRGKTPSEDLARSCQVIALIFHLLYGMSHRHARLLLAAFRAIIRLTSRITSSSSSSSSPSSTLAVSDDIPRNIHTVSKHFALEPRVRQFVCCPKCFALYGEETCPDLCMYRSTPSSGACGAKLWRTRVIRGRSHHIPVLQYSHRSLRDWIGTFLSLPGVEDHLERTVSPERPEFATDFWDAEEIRAFCGPGTEPTAYMDTTNAPPDTLRLVFSLAADGFNPFQSKPGKGSVTSTGIYLVCLNLPSHLRFRPEYMCLVGTIPGHPSKEQMNGFLGLLVDDLLQFWDPGVYFSRTAKCSLGRWVNVAIIPIVSDLPAVRQLIGLGAVNSTFFCHCCYIELADNENFDSRSWPLRDLDEHRRAALAWRDANSTEERERLFKINGIRWTELWRLPYFRAFLISVIESMHNHYLGLLQDHCRECWGMDWNTIDGEGWFHPTKSAPQRPSRADMELGAHYLLYGSEAQLMTCRKAILWHLCLDRGLRRAGTVKKLIASLLSWRAREALPAAAPMQAPMNLANSTTPTVSVPANAPPVVAGPSTQRDVANPAVTTHPAQSSTLNPSSRQPLRQVGTLPQDMESHRVNIIHGERLLWEGYSANSLGRVGRNALIYMCDVRGLSHLGYKKDLAHRLIVHRDNTTVPVSGDTPSLAAHEPRATVAEAPLASRSDVPPIEPSSSAADSAAHASQVLPAQSEASGVPNAGGHNGTAPVQPAPVQPTPVQPTPVHPASIPGGRPQPDVRGSHVLGKQTLQQAHADAELTELPSWVSRAPRGFGSTTRGKLSADQWRTLCTVHLVVTLIRLWHNGTERKQKMLKNYMDLVTAVGIGGMLRMSEDGIKAYEKHLQRYLNDFKDLYPEAVIKPNHHLSLHLGYFLRRLGPVHSWRSFGIERFNYVLQGLNTNMRVGDIEHTYMTHVARAANLRILLHDPALQSSIGEVLDVHNSLAQEDHRGTRIADDLQLGSQSMDRQATQTPSPTSLSDKAYRALLHFVNQEASGEYIYGDRLTRRRTADQSFLWHKAVHLSQLKINGVTYKTEAAGSRDSNLVFRSSVSQLRGARVVHIIIHERTNPISNQIHIERLLLVRCLPPLSIEDVPKDPYRKFGYAGGFLCYDNDPGTLQAIRPSSVVCHFASTNVKIIGIDSPCIHVLPLDRLLQLDDFPPEDHTEPSQVAGNDNAIA